MGKLSQQLHRIANDIHKYHVFSSQQLHEAASKVDLLETDQLLLRLKTEAAERERNFVAELAGKTLDKIMEKSSRMEKSK